jgi:hypothetical protein
MHTKSGTFTVACRVISHQMIPVGTASHIENYRGVCDEEKASTVDAFEVLNHA